MSELIVRELKRYPKGELPPFFAGRVAAAARDGQQARHLRLLKTYWLLALVASVYIVIRAPWTTMALQAVALLSIPAGFALLFGGRRAIRRLVASFTPFS